MYSSQIYCAIKRPFLPGQHIILYCLVEGEMCTIFPHISWSQWPFIKYFWMVFAKGLWSFGPCRGQSPWHQPKKFLFPYPRFLRRSLLRPPDISSVALPTDWGNQPPMLKQLDLLLSPFRGWKPFNLVWKWDFFYLYYEGCRIYGSQQKKTM